MDQTGSTYSKRRTVILEPGRGKLYTLSHTYDRFLATSHHYRGKNRKRNWTNFFWWRSLIETETSKGNNVGCVELIVFFVIIKLNQPKNMFHQSRWRRWCDLIVSFNVQSSRHSSRLVQTDLLRMNPCCCLIRRRSNRYRSKVSLIV